VSVLEGTLLLGGLLGWLFVRQWRAPGPGAPFARRLWGDRYLAGTVFGLAVGVGLALLFLLLFVSGLMNPQPDPSVVLPVSASLIAAEQGTPLAVTGADATVTADIATAIAQSNAAATDTAVPAAPATQPPAATNTAVPVPTQTRVPAANTPIPGATNTQAPAA